MSWRGWVRLYFGGAVVLAILVFACASLAQSTAVAPGTKRFQGDGISFRYPARWQALTDPNDTSSFSALIVYVSNDQMSSPCVVKPMSISCGLPLAHLSERSVLASWSANGFPGWTFKRALGRALRVDGDPAKLRLTRSVCGVGADVMMDVVVERPHVADNWFEFRACIKGPGINELERQAKKVLRTVHFAG